MSEGEGVRAVEPLKQPKGNPLPKAKPRRTYVTPTVTHPDQDDATPYEVVYERPGGHAERHFVTKAGLLLGRGEDCDIVLAEKFVSRQHARIWVEDDKLWIRDIGSSNGIKVDGKRTMGSDISAGAELWVGVARLKAGPAVGLTVRRSCIPLTEAPGVEDDILHDLGTERLTVLYRAAQLLGTVFDDEELYARLVALALDSVPARRGFIIERSPEGAVKILAHRSLSDDQNGPPLSRALIGEALNHGDAVMTLDARTDARFANSASILSHEIHSAMCVPLVGRKGVCGAIYADSGSQPVRFSEEDLTLLTAIGRLAGIGIENSRLHKQAIEHERLATLGMATANLGHCMKNILTGFRGGGEFVRLGIEGEDMAAVKRGWGHVARCVDRIDGLVMNMLTFGRDDRQWVETHADVIGAVNQAIATAHPRAEKYHVDLVFSPPGMAISVRGDTQELYRVILNLVTNAVDACVEQGGTVVVSVQPGLDEIELRVRDNGPGIRPEITQDLFTPFYTTKGSSGTGLGLSTAQKIVQEHGGTIAVESTPGDGATFIVRLPVHGATTVMRRER